MAQRSRNRPNRNRPQASSVVAPVISPPSAATSLFGFEVSEEEVAENQRAGWRLLIRLGVERGLGVGLIVAVVSAAAGLGWWGILVGVLAFVVATAIVTALGRKRTALYALHRIPAHPVSEAEEPRLANLARALSATFGLTTPHLAVLEDAVPNACAVGHGHGATLVVTRGLLEGCDLIELEGVVAHELAHLRRGDGDRGAISVLYAVDALPLKGRDVQLHDAVGRGRELRADQVGAAAVRSPAGILAALRRCEQAPAPTATSFFCSREFERTRWLWFDPMVGQRSPASALANNDATSVRIAVLEEW